MTVSPSVAVVKGLKSARVQLPLWRRLLYPTLTEVPVEKPCCRPKLPAEVVGKRSAGTGDDRVALRGRLMPPGGGADQGGVEGRNARVRRWGRTCPAGRDSFRLGRDAAQLADVRGDRSGWVVGADGGQQRATGAAHTGGEFPHAKWNAAHRAAALGPLEVGPGDRRRRSAATRCRGCSRAPGRWRPEGTSRSGRPGAANRCAASS